MIGNSSTKGNSSDISISLSYFIQDSPQAIAMFDKDMNYIACSPQWLHDWWKSKEKKDPKEMVGKNHYELFKDIPPAWKSVHQRALAGATEACEDDRMIVANGETEWLRWHVRPWRDSHGDIGGIVIFTEFITSRKEAEQLVIASQAKLSKLVENLPGMAYSCDNDEKWTIRFVSNGALELTGYTPEEFIDEKSISFSKITREEDKPRVWKNIQKCLKNKEIFEISYRIQTKSNETKHLFERGQGVYDPEGNLVSIEGIILDITDQRLMEDALGKSNANLVQAQKVAQLGSWEWDITTDQVFWSEEFYNICGFKRGEIEPSLDGMKLIHPNDRDKFEQGISKLLTRGQHYQSELRLIRKNGDLRYIRIEAELIESAEKKIVGTLQDITDGKLAEIALKESEERNKALVSALPDMIFIHQLDGTFLDFEIPRKSSLIAVSNELIGQPLEAYYDRSTSEKFRKKFLLSYKNREIQTIDYQNIINNKKRYFEARIVKYKLGQVLVMVRDVTKNKQVELVASESQKKFYKAFHISPVPVTISKLEGGFLLDVNDRFCELVNMDREDIVGKTTVELNLWENGEARKEFISLLKKEGKVYGKEFQIRTSDKSLKAVLLSAEMIEIEEKQCILLMISDISESKKSEKALIKLTEELTASNHELRQFAYITSHNLRAPVVNIDTLLSFLNKEDSGDPDNKGIIDRIEQSVFQLKSSLNDLIQLVALKDKKHEDAERIFFQQIYDTVYQSIETQIRSASAEIETEFEVASIICKKAILESILLNLLSNAIKYRKESPPKIKIKTYKDNGSIGMSISDNGLGIDLEKNRSKLFGMYQRFHENKEGKGLGLYIIKSQIDTMGGEIEVESQPNEGTTFKVLFKNKRDGN